MWFVLTKDKQTILSSTLSHPLSKRSTFAFNFTKKQQQVALWLVQHKNDFVHGHNMHLTGWVKGPLWLYIGITPYCCYSWSMLKTEKLCKQFWQLCMWIFFIMNHKRMYEKLTLFTNKMSTETCETQCTMFGHILYICYSTFCSPLNFYTLSGFEPTIVRPFGRLRCRRELPRTRSLHQLLITNFLQTSSRARKKCNYLSKKFHWKFPNTTYVC
jgi:hypothetical protein